MGRSTRRTLEENVMSLRPPATTDRVYLATLLRSLWPHPPLRFYRGEFFEYRDSTYAPVASSLIRQFLWTQLDVYYNEQSDLFKKPAISANFIHDVESALQSIAFVSPDTVLPAIVEPTVLEPVNTFMKAEETHPGSEPDMAIFANGVLNLSHLLNDDLATLFKPNASIMSVNAFGFDYRRHATCPRWIKTIARIFEDDTERIDVLQEIFGYCLLPGNKMQRFFQFDGAASTGKTTVSHVLTALVGASNVSHVPLDLFSERFQLGSSIGKLVNISSDPGKISPKVTALVKQFTGDDVMFIDRKHLPPISTAATTKLVILCNEPPEFVDHSQGLWRRLVRLPFTSVVSKDEYDPDIKDKLIAELPGIFNWALAGRQRLEVNNAFTESIVVTAATEEAKEEQDPVSEWISDHIHRDGLGLLDSQTLYGQYVRDMEYNQERPITTQKFCRIMRAKFPGIARIKTRISANKLGRSWVGVSRVQ